MTHVKNSVAEVAKRVRSTRPSQFGHEVGANAKNNPMIVNSILIGVTAVLVAAQTSADADVGPSVGAGRELFVPMRLPRGRLS